MNGPMAQASESSEEALQIEYEELCNEALELQAELRAGKIEVQQLQLRLKASNCGSASTPSTASVLPTVLEEPRAQELQHLFKWLADTVDLSDIEIFDVGFEVPIGGRRIHLHRVVQWPLSVAGLQLTAPLEHREPLGNLLASTRSTGKVDTAAVLHFLSGWDLIAGEFAASGAAEPSVLLSHRDSTQGILVAAWPTREALQVSRACSSSLRLGERVEVEYDGQMYPGVLHAVDAHGMANIRCDADPPGVMTVTPLSRVHRIVGCQDVAEISVATVNDLADDVRQGTPKMHRRTRSSAL
mmetsp:Transcript_21284/g.26250  ORF Transcript_21284/g.26250 Transcript_21284/m.26250 type:complete len:299 (-) Transcript_21284:119-1015(-)